MIETKNLSKYFGNLKAVDNLNFRLQRGEILGFLGPNGAGKTTTMRMLTGFLSPSVGEIFINDIDIFNNSMECKKLIGYVPEGSPLYSEMNTIDFLKFCSQIRINNPKVRRNNLENVIGLLNLNNILFQKIETLSKGFKRRVGLAQAIIHDPDILILDEPTDGLDPNQKNEVRQLIKRLGKNKAIIISTHLLEEVNVLCNRLMIISKGRLLLDDKPLNVLKKSESYNNINVSIEEMSALNFKKEIINKKVCKNVDIINGLCVIKTQNNKNIKNDLDALIKKNKFTIKNYTHGPGSLEEVFRRLTNND